MVTPNILRIPFEVRNGLMLVEAEADSVSGKFIFDSGAERLVLNSKYFKGKGGGAMTAGVTGNVGEVGSLDPAYFKMDQLISKELRADVVNLGHIEQRKKFRLLGLLGYEVFKDFELIVDFDLQQITLIRTDKLGKRVEALAQGEYENGSTFIVKLSGFMPVAEVYFGKKKLSFGFDTGAEQNLLDHQLGGKFLKENFEIVKRVKLNGAGPSSIEVISGNLKNASLNNKALDTMATLLTDLTALNEIYGTQLDGILGYEFFKQQPIGINYKSKQMTIFEKSN